MSQATTICVGFGTRNRRTPSGPRGMALRRIRQSLLGLSVLGALFTARRGFAQEEVVKVITPHLTVRPHEMATGSRTDRAGQFAVDSNAIVYVPQQCVGTRRCPLVVTFIELQYTKDIADKYGWIFLFPSLSMRIVYDPRSSAEPESHDAEYLDAAIKKALETLAIDPNRIAVVGRCATGMNAIAVGENNPHVFSRIATFTANAGDPPVRAPNQSIEYFLSTGLLEDAYDFGGARLLRQRGYPIKHMLAFRGHVHQDEDYDFMGQWLAESWAIPNPASRPAPFVFTEPVPALTAEVITRMTTFWTRFMQQPDSIRTAGRRAQLREVVVPLESDSISALMTNMPALAAKFPAVAADLKAAGLTPPQHDAYRVALFGARLLSNNRRGYEKKYNNLADTVYFLSPYSGQRFTRSYQAIFAPVPVKSTSVLMKNADFLNTHPDELKALEATHMWETP